MDNWLKNRLTPAKLKITRWHELASVIEKLWEFYFDPLVDRTRRLRSSYTADAEDLIKKIRECGDYFCLEIPPSEVNRPVQYAWRRLELQYKEIEDIINASLRRHFGDFIAYWYPLFAAKDKPYGTDLLTPDDFYKHTDWQKNVPPEGYFLTSRGILAVNKNSLYKYDYDKFLFMVDAKPIIQRTKPLHNVFENFLWFIEFDLGIFDPLFDVSWEVLNSIDLLFGPLGSRFDIIKGDVRHLDNDVFTITSESQRFSKIFFVHPFQFWHLDRFIPEGFGHWIPLEYVLPYYETPLKSFLEHSPFYWIYSDIRRPASLVFNKIFFDLVLSKIDRLNSLIFYSDTDFTAEIDRTETIDYNEIIFNINHRLFKRYSDVIFNKINSSFASDIYKLYSLLFNADYDYNKEIDRFPPIYFEHDYLFVKEAIRRVTLDFEFIFDRYICYKQKINELLIDCNIDIYKKDHDVNQFIDFLEAPITRLSFSNHKYKIIPEWELVLQNLKEVFASVIMPYVEVKSREESDWHAKIDFDEPPLNCAISFLENENNIEFLNIQILFKKTLDKLGICSFNSIESCFIKDKGFNTKLSFLDAPITSIIHTINNNIDIILDNFKLELNNIAFTLFNIIIEYLKIALDKKTENKINMDFLAAPMVKFNGKSEKRIVFNVPTFGFELLENQPNF